MRPVVTIEKIHPDAVLPAYQTAGAAGADLSAVVVTSGVITFIRPGERMVVDTGLRIALPPGYEAQIRSRSGLAAKNGVFVLNAPGTVDADYRGAIKVILFNSGKENFAVRTGDRIAQMVIAPVVQAIFDDGKITEDTERGAGGFGSTGVSRNPVESL